MLTPIRIVSSTPQDGEISAFSSSSASRISKLARTARSASSSCTNGIPNTAMTASPMNFSTVAPCRSSTRRIPSKKRACTRRSDSGSSRSPNPVEPARSAKTTVTIFRTSWPAAPLSARGAPHDRQKRASSGFRCPHSPQTAMSKGYGSQAFGSMHETSGPFGPLVVPSSRYARFTRLPATSWTAGPLRPRPRRGAGTQA